MELYLNVNNLICWVGIPGHLSTQRCIIQHRTSTCCTVCVLIIITPSSSQEKILTIGQFCTEMLKLSPYNLSSANTCVLLLSLLGLNRFSDWKNLSIHKNLTATSSVDLSYPTPHMFYN